ncbi:NAD(P)-binding domain-containing protein, partial [Candidatus Auribacterota bacterium]
MKIAVIGDGGWGTTLAVLLANKGHAVTIWGPFEDYISLLREKRENVKFLPKVKLPDGIDLTSDIGVALNDAALAVIAVPSHYMRAVMQRLQASGPPDILFVSV